MYIPVCHTNGRSGKNTIGMVLNHLVGMVLKGFNTCYHIQVLTGIFHTYFTQEESESGSEADTEEEKDGEKKDKKTKKKKKVRMTF